jgi:hypothetical protein
MMPPKSVGKLRDSMTCLANDATGSSIVNGQLLMETVLGPAYPVILFLEYYNGTLKLYEHQPFHAGAWPLAIPAVMATNIDRVPPGIGLEYLANL